MRLKDAHSNRVLISIKARKTSKANMLNAIVSRHKDW
jgi:hypothetical protein